MEGFLRSITMEKTPRYTASEKRLLLKLIHNQKEIIEKKKTDAFTNRSKENAWQVITKTYNNYVKFKRTTKQLRQLYKNMKYAANVNSTSTSNLTEMLEILDMQIINDPNIKSGENMLISSSNHPPPEATQQQQYHHPQQNAVQEPKKGNHTTNSSKTIQNVQHNYDANRIVKTELIDDDDFDDEQLSLAALAAANSDQEILDFSKFTGPSTSPQHHYTAHDLDDDIEIDDEIDDDDVDDDDDDDNNSFPSILQTTLQEHSKPPNKTSLSQGGCASSANNKPNLVNTKEMLISIAIEERRKKIELLETQINYWKKLTTKIENCDKICCCKIDNYNNRNFVIE